MPIENGVGWGDHSDDKQNDFRSMLSLHIDIVNEMTSRPSNRWRRMYTYIDMNAGPGYYNGIIGSPVAFLDKIEPTSIAYNAIFIEQEQANAQSLQQLIREKRPRGSVRVINDDHNAALRSVAIPTKQSYGAIYHDPSGSVPNFDLLAEISQNTIFDYMDIFVYLSATNIKRVRRCDAVQGRDAKVKMLTDYLTSINKRTWIVRRAQGRHQWTFAIGSNWKDFPAWKNRGFYKVDSPEGRDVLSRLTYTADELDMRSGQLALL